MALSGNFRSRPELIGAVNVLGSALIGDSFRPAAGRRPSPSRGPAGEAPRSSCC